MKRLISNTWSIVAVILILLFNVCFFLLTTDDVDMGRSITTWISYGFIHVAFLFLLLAPIFVTKGASTRDTAPSVFYVCVTYWWIELIVGVFFILMTSPAVIRTVINPLIDILSGNVIIEFFANWIFDVLHSDPNKFGIISQTIIFGLFIVVLVIVRAVDKDTEEQELRREHELQYVKTAEAQLKFKLAEITEKNTARKVEQLYDYIRTSPLKSHNSVRDIENTILNKVLSIVSENDNETIFTQAEETLRLAEQRNKMLLINNNKL